MRNLRHQPCALLCNRAKPCPASSAYHAAASPDNAPAELHDERVARPQCDMRAAVKAAAHRRVARALRQLHAQLRVVGEDQRPEAEAVGADGREQDAWHGRVHLQPDSLLLSTL